jgi:hypothetical protein
MVFQSLTSIGEEARRLWPQGRSIGQSVDMPPKKTSGLTASKKRPHEAPVKGRKSFAGSRQKVAKGGGGGGDRDDDAGGDDMLEDALDEDEFGRKKGKKGGDSDEDSDEEVKETADEKRLRLAKSYLEKLRREEAEDGSGSDEDEDEDNIRNMDSHDRLANRLKNEAMAKSGRVRREIAHRVVAPTLDDDSDVDEDDETETEGDAWRDIRRGHKLSVTGMSLTPDDSTCYTVSKDGSIARWDIETGARTRFPRGPPRGCRPHPRRRRTDGAAQVRRRDAALLRGLPGAQHAMRRGYRQAHPRLGHAHHEEGARVCVAPRRGDRPRHPRRHRPDVLLVDR